MKHNFTAGMTAFTLAVTAVMNMSVLNADAETTEISATGSQETVSATASAENDKTTESRSSAAAERSKAELGRYNGSLSLVSYETSPEMPGNNVVAAGARTPGIPTPVPLRTSNGEIKSIPYTNSEPAINSDPGQFAIVTYGWGHGVGLSQNGANFYAEYSGWNYQDILFHYYPDTYLMNTGTAEDEKITVNGKEGTALDQVAEIVNCEVGGWMNYEAIKAQAVAVYTYCKYNGNDGADLRGKPNPPQIVIDACKEVLGEALYYNDSFALTMFSASSGGITANCYEVFWADLPYLRTVSSDYDAALDPHYGTVTYFTDTYIKNMIERKYEIKLSPDPGNWIKPVYSDTTGYVTEVNIDDKMTVKGYDFKLDMGFKSPKFRVYYTYKSSNGEYDDGNDDTEVRYEIEEIEIDMSADKKSEEDSDQENMESEQYSDDNAYYENFGSDYVDDNGYEEYIGDDYSEEYDIYEY